ncbi:peptidase M20 [Acuticoccus sediminis]|uniref:Peptidase M20 n=1 Tax=Acuticoccus sediminis TaxID=2184697 RepID=A0A8B2NY49_9HYPH|nr:M20/M25/M40 family metallo-hydrolase [Acuticoccus sediminis]RAI01520.1 peptidase M20 [Acuticoccus sediminis]
MGARETLLAEIERDRDEIVALLSRFVAAPSPNPPGDTAEATAVLTDYLGKAGVPFRTVTAEGHPNIVGGFDGASGGPHLVLNGHIDVFPVSPDEAWTHPPFSGAVADGQVWGRGTTDMKAGTIASVITYVYLHRLREALGGRLTLTAVSDEETGGKWGALYLLRELGDEVRGDAVLNGEPSNTSSVRFCEKGTLRLTFTIRANGAHGAYPNKSENPNRIAGKLMERLDRLTELAPDTPEALAALLADPKVRAAIDAAMGAGTADIADKVTVNYGVVNGGVKVNIIPSVCRMEVDIRLPIGIDRAAVLAEIETILADFPQTTLEVQEAASNASSYSEPDHPIAALVQKNAAELGRPGVVPIPSMGASDCKHFRHFGVPSYIYGVPAGNMGRADEAVAIDDFMHVVKTHALTAFDYLSGGRT